MRRSTVWAAVVAAALPAAAQDVKVEKVAIPGTTLSFEMVLAPAGSLKTGGREIALQPFWIARTEVTWEAWAHFFGNRKVFKVDGITRPSTPYEPPHGAQGVGAHPAVSLRWHGAMAYCDWLSKVTGQVFRLPTDAEWEYAARAGQTGEGPAALDDVAWHKGNSSGKTKIGGQKKANPFGLYDAIGNVWEYVLEFQNPVDYAPILRGGSWNTSPAELKFDHRQTIPPEWYERDPNRPRSLWWLTDAAFVGFRVVRVVDAPSKGAMEAYLPKVQVGPLKLGRTFDGSRRLAGTVMNAGDRSLDEVELLVAFLDADGKPQLEDNKMRPGYTYAFPVLVHGFHPGEHAKPLAAGGSREFEVDCPIPMDLDAEPDQAAARVTALKFSK